MEVLIHNFLVSFPTWGLILLVAISLYTLSKGADILVDEAVSLSIHWGVPKMIIGATIVSLGTTLPEASVSVIAAFNGNPDLALGNAIGSIIADTGLILGLAALIGKLPVDRIIVERQGKIQVWSGLLLAIVCLPFFSKGSTGNISQVIGWLFIGLLIAYIYVSIKWSKSSSSNEIVSTPNTSDPTVESTSSESVLIEEKSPIILQILKLIAGIVIVICSSKILIPSVEITAIRVGIPQSIIAATLIAFGTSLPELVTAITAVRKGHGELAIGNIVGADILNVLFVVGGAAAVTKGGLQVPLNFYKLQIPTMVIILTTFRLFARGQNEEITKKEGFVLFSIYIIYIVLNYTWI
ncbi:calcium/sodium antiporter [Sporosalibacterium faouarense]|uniref:calcium/sodium antiporter n=1 Tax=Sporosalibacterium faouarense TaxID=516123 RepID=UPI00141D4472|nr:calcium/sodium antiporter [Bacillota bacterium]